MFRHTEKRKGTTKRRERGGVQCVFVNSIGEKKRRIYADLDLKGSTRPSGFQGSSSRYDPPLDSSARVGESLSSVLVY